MILNQQKIALITGAAGEIGCALATEFKKAKYFVIATDIHEKSNNLECDFYIKADLNKIVEDKLYANTFFKNIKKSIGKKHLSILINNAAIQILGGVNNLSRRDWQETLNVNLIAPFLISQELFKKLQESNGSILNISSIHAKLTKKNFLAYSTSKAALSAMSRAMAIDLGGRVRVNVIEPAAIQTRMLNKSFGNKSNYKNDLKTFHPSRSIADPEELAKFIVNLSLNDQAFLTGSCIEFSGGISSVLHDPNSLE